jgi:hypothetical protein
MEKRLNNKISEYTSLFKENIKDKATQLNIIDCDKTLQLIQYIYDYERLILNKEDLIKRKRVKNIVPGFERCIAKRSNNEQCTRRKKKNCEYCGTHIKGTPHGLIDNTNDIKQLTHKIEVWAQDIKGIVYYIDNHNNVYQTEDIIMNKTNPAIIAKCVKNGDIYNIPEFGI